MSDHTITYDLQHPGNGEMECLATPDAPCRAVWDCGCESIYGYHVAEGVPHHFSTYDGDEVQVRGHHVGRFDPDHCNIRDWHENSEEDVTGTVRVAVDPSWEHDYYVFEAVSAELANPTTRSPEGATS